MSPAMATWRQVLPEVCGEGEDPPVLTRDPLMVDFSERESTPDQLRIEAELAGLRLRGKRLLHVGVGNSRLAARFHHELLWIDGLTVSEAEKAHADSLAIPNYRVLIANKYRPSLWRRRRSYDLIVDNNPIGFACCQRHFRRFLESLVDCLVPGGRILTDPHGLSWLHGGGRGPTRDELSALLRHLPVEVSPPGSPVLAIERLPASL